MSYSSILKSTKKPVPAPLPAKTVAKSKDVSTNKMAPENTTAKKKVKSKDPVIVDLLSFLQEKVNI